MIVPSAVLARVKRDPEDRRGRGITREFPCRRQSLSAACGGPRMSPRTSSSGAREAVDASNGQSCSVSWPSPRDEPGDESRGTGSRVAASRGAARRWVSGLPGARCAAARGGPVQLAFGALRPLPDRMRAERGVIAKLCQRSVGCQRRVRARGAPPAARGSSNLRMHRSNSARFRRIARARPEAFSHAGCPGFTHD